MFHTAASEALFVIGDFFRLSELIDEVREAFAGAGSIPVDPVPRVASLRSYGILIPSPRHAGCAFGTASHD